MHIMFGTMMLEKKPNSGDMYGSLSLGQMSPRQL